MADNMQEVWLYLDDIRPAPEGWTLAKSAKEALEIARKGNVTRMSLDCDLGDAEYRGSIITKWTSHGETGIWFVEQIIKENLCPRRPPVIHSQNEQGKAEMKRLLSEYYRRQRFPIT